MVYHGGPATAPIRLIDVSHAVFGAVRHEPRVQGSDGVPHRTHSGSRPLGRRPVDASRGCDCPSGRPADAGTCKADGVTHTIVAGIYRSDRSGQSVRVVSGAVGGVDGVAVPSEPNGTVSSSPGSPSRQALDRRVRRWTGASQQVGGSAGTLVVTPARRPGGIVVASSYFCPVRVVSDTVRVHLTRVRTVVHSGRNV